MQFLTSLRKKNSFLRNKRFYAQFVRKGDLCFDIGANVGEKSAIFLALGAKVIAVEPQTRCMEHLNTLKRKYHDKIVIVNAAISDRSGEAGLYLGNVSEVSTLSEKFMSEFGKHGVLQWKDKEMVTTVTINDLITKYGEPRFCKIDTEGYEWNIIAELNKRIPFIEFEYTPVFLNDTMECIKHISKLGATNFNFTKYEQPQLVLPGWVNAEEIIRELAIVDRKIIHGNVFARQDLGS